MKSMDRVSARRTQLHIRTLTYCAMMAAMLCILSPIAVPIGPIPVSLGLFGVFLAGVLLGPVYGTISVLVFMLLGVIGLPVFSGGMGGFQVLLGPTGGYAWSYPLVTAISGSLTSAAFRMRKRHIRILLVFLLQIPGIALCYFLGTLQFCLLMNRTAVAALSACVIPFIPFDLAKIFVAAVIGVLLRERIAFPDLRKKTNSAPQNLPGNDVY